MNKKTLLWMSDSFAFETGYANISRQICNRLVERGWEVHYLANGFVGQTLAPGTTFKDGTKCNFTVWGQGRAPYNQDVITHRIRETGAQVFVTLLDTFMVYPWFTGHDFSPAKTVFYFPSDGGGGMPTGCEQILSRMSAPVAMSKYAQKQCKDYYNLDTLYIPHACDPDVYYPLSTAQKAAAKARFGLQGKFVVGCVARNQPRKMMDRLFKAFALFCRDKPDTVLFLHTDPYDNAAVFDMMQLIRRHKLENRVCFSGMTFYKGFHYKEMNEVYNAMDVFFLSTSGEGWGVPTIEAMSAEIPVLITDYTTTQEIVKNHNCGFGVNLVGTEEINWLEDSIVNKDWLAMNGTITGSWVVERGIMDIKDAQAKLTILYYDKEMREEMGKNGRKAVLAEYDWNKVVEQWDELLTRMVEW